MLWDPKIGPYSLSDFDASPLCFGVAILVANDDELVATTGILKTNSGEAIMKAEFERLDGRGSIVQGILGPFRWREPGDHGLALNRGPDSAVNRRILVGTLLQGAEWKTVVEYGKWLRRSPLL